jgi:hypothetical protein
MQPNASNVSGPKIVWLGLLVMLASQQLHSRAASGDPIADFESMRKSQQRNIEQSIAGMPPLGGRGELALGDIFRIRMEGLDLLVRTPFDSTLVPGYTRARVPEFAQPVMVRIVGGADRKAHAPGEAVVPDELLFTAADYSKPGQITSLSLSQSGSVIFSLSQTQTAPSGSRTIQFLIQKVPSLPGGGGVTLIVNESGFRPDLPHSSLTLGATDCATFLRRHPRAVGQYLMPLLAELGQDGVFAPDPLLAMQVFPEHFSPDPAASRRVEAILPALDAGNYHRRDDALAQLRQMGKDAAKVMVFLDRSTFTPEQNARIDQALTPAGLIPRAEADRLRRDREFLLNCLYCDDPITRRSALAEIKSLTGRSFELPENLSPSERIAAINELRAKLEDKE